MSSVTISGDTSGSIILQAPAVSGSTTLTLPTTSGTVLTTANTFGAGTGPAFSAERNTTQSFSTDTFTKVLCQNETFDTNSNYDATTARFTPTVAGYYQFNGTVTITSSSTNNRQILAFFKNNSQALRPVDYRISYGTAVAMFSGTGLVYMNGSTDFIELFLYVTGAGTLNIVAQGAGELSTFSGFLARPA